MTKRLLPSFLISTLLVSTTPLALAHHSVAGQFNMQQSVTLQGVVSKVDWVNPHIHITLDVKDKSGKAESWLLECVPVGMARKAGLTKSMMEGHGETVTVIVYPARDGTQHLGFMTKLTFPDGHFFQFAPETNGAKAPG
jgi:hypothetical protein